MTAALAPMVSELRLDRKRHELSYGATDRSAVLNACLGLAPPGAHAHSEVGTRPLAPHSVALLARIGSQVAGCTALHPCEGAVQNRMHLSV